MWGCRSIEHGAFPSVSSTGFPMKESTFIRFEKYRAKD
jgi:hypothetical protein